MTEYFKDKVAVVTGASSGIGLAVCREFAAHKAKLVLAARSEERLATIASELSALTETIYVKTDVTSEEECRNLIGRAVEKFGRIDILVNNAGISMRAIFSQLDLSVIRKLMDVNFWGTVYCTKYALPYLLESKGSVVGVISTAGYKGLPARTGYSASKFAINGFLDTLRVENIYNGLHVLVFAPGFTSSNIRKTALLADGAEQGDTPRNEAKMMSAERVARILLRSIMRRRRKVTLTLTSKMLLLLNRIMPGLADRIEYHYMASEPDSPLPAHPLF